MGDAFLSNTRLLQFDLYDPLKIEASSFDDFLPELFPKLPRQFGTDLITTGTDGRTYHRGTLSRERSERPAHRLERPTDDVGVGSAPTRVNHPYRAMNRVVEKDRSAICDQDAERGSRYVRNQRVRVREFRRLGEVFGGDLGDIRGVCLLRNKERRSLEFQGFQKPSSVFLNGVRRVAYM